MKIFFSFLAILLLFGGCGETPKPRVVKPTWIGNHDVGAVGSCATHIRGNAAQEAAAYDRALKKLAKQKSARIKSSSVSSQHESSQRYSSSYDSSTSVSTDATVSSHEEKTWRNPKTNTYYIWLVPN